MKYYHATDSTNIDSILTQGLMPGHDGVVYMTTKPEECLRFMVFRGAPQITVLELSVQGKVEEQFDHSEKFWGCRCWGVYKTIPAKNIKVHSVYQKGDSSNDSLEV